MIGLSNSAEKSTQMNENIRPLTSDDLGAVEHIQREAYPHYHKEALAVFAEKLARYPAGCWAYEIERNVVGYLFSHPCRLAKPPRLDELLEDRLDDPDCYFLHDKAVLPTHRGAGAGRQLLTAVFEHAANLGFTTIALVAVQNARPYWQRHGFRLVAECEAVEAVRRSYGPEACYMIRDSAST